MAMGTDQIMGVPTRPFVKTYWSIKEMPCRPTKFNKRAFKILKDIIPQQYKEQKTSGIK